MIDYDFDRLKGLGWSDDFIEKIKDDPCWKGYQAIGMKTKNGRKVPNCAKVKSDSEHGEGFDIDEKQPMDAMAIGNALPKEPATGPVKNPQMKEAGIRMPRVEEIAKASNRNGHLAMAAAPNYSELDSDENNGAMIVNQLRVIREKTDILLGMLDGTDNLPPWCFVKITNAGTGLASVADYLRYGTET